MAINLQLQHAQQHDAVEMQAATQSTLLDLLGNQAVLPASVSRFLSAFPISESMLPGKRLLLARQCWEHLLEGAHANFDEHVIGKMELSLIHI